MNPEILYEDDNIVAINKLAGMMTHPDGHTTDETVSDWFARAYPASREVGETQRLPDGTEIARPGVVHRLDRDTSGVLILVKTPEAHAFYKAAFQERLTKKTYLAVVYGTLKEEKGTIEFSIGRSRKDFRLRSAQPKARGTLREAITHYEVIDTIGTHSLVKLMQETGRTHQIRVHLKALHHPVVCDPLYAIGKPCDLGTSRLALHAASLVLPLPEGGTVHIQAPVPADLHKAVSAFPGAASVIASF